MNGQEIKSSHCICRPRGPSARLHNYAFEREAQPNRGNAECWKGGADYGAGWFNGHGLEESHLIVLLNVGGSPTRQWF